MTRNPIVHRSHFQGNSALPSHLEEARQIEIRGKIQPLIDIASSAMIVLDSDNAQIIAVNSRFLQLTGHAEEDVINRPIQILLPEDEVKYLLTCPEISLNGGFQPQGIYSLVTASAREIELKTECYIQEVEGMSLSFMSFKPNNVSFRDTGTSEINSLIDRIDSYLWTIDSDLKMRRINKAAREMFQRGFNIQLNPGDDFRALLNHNEFRARDLWENHIADVLQNGSSTSFVVSDTFKEAFMHIEVQMQAILDKNGTVEGLSCHVVNKTDEYLRHRLIEVLDEFKTRIIPVDDVDQLMWLVTDEVLARLNFEDALILLVENDKLIAKAAHGAQRKEAKNEVWPLVLNIGEGITGTVAQTGLAEIVNDTTRDPRYYSHHFVGGSEIAVPIRVDKRVIGVINCESKHPGFFTLNHLDMLKEVTELVATKIGVINSNQELRSVEALNQTLLDSTPTGFFLLDQNTKIQSFNRAAAKVFHDYFDKELEAGVDISKFIPRQYTRAFKAAMTEALSGGMQKSEKELIHPRFGSMWFAFTFAPANDQDKEIVGVALTMEHVTDKKLQENLIKRQNRELRKTNRELDKFVYSVSHDLRSPITNVLGLSTLLHASETMEDVEQYTDMIKGAMYRMDNLIHNILDYSRNNRLEISCEGIDLRELVEEVIMDHRHIDTFQSISIYNKVNEDERIKSDPQRLKIILNNLVSNAMKYHDEEKDERFIEISASKIGGDTAIKVSDNGQGIEKKHFPHLLKMFYTANLRAKGSGIGLYILNDAVNQLNGKIGLKSEPGKGTVFTITLPDITS